VPFCDVEDAGNDLIRLVLSLPHERELEAVSALSWRAREADVFYIGESY
jgi:hypothetical protein